MHAKKSSSFLLSILRYLGTVSPFLGETLGTVSSWLGKIFFPLTFCSCQFFKILTKYHCAKFQKKPDDWIPSNTGFSRMHGRTNARTDKYKFIRPFRLKLGVHHNIEKHIWDNILKNGPKKKKNLKDLFPEFYLVYS